MLNKNTVTLCVYFTRCENLNLKQANEILTCICKMFYPIALLQFTMGPSGQLRCAKALQLTLAVIKPDAVAHPLIMEVGIHLFLTRV